MKPFHAREVGHESSYRSSYAFSVVDAGIGSKAFQVAAHLAPVQLIEDGCGEVQAVDSDAFEVLAVPVGGAFPGLTCFLYSTVPAARLERKI